MSIKHTDRRTFIPTTSVDPNTPLELDIRPGTPAVDLRRQIIGCVWAVTARFCIMCTADGTLVTVPWRHIAIGCVRPAEATLPIHVDERDRLKCETTVLRDLEDANHFFSAERIPSPLKRARHYLTRRLRTNGHHHRQPPRA